MTAVEHSIGERMPDGTVYAGISPDTRNPMYAMPADSPLTMTFNQAAENAKTANSQKAHGHDDWHVPTQKELNVLFNNRGAIGRFDLTGSYPAGWYWSGSRNGKSYGWSQSFSIEDRGNYFFYDEHYSSVRLVRDGTEEYASRKLRQEIDLLKKAITPRALS
jgi:hypothetical protein